MSMHKAEGVRQIFNAGSQVLGDIPSVMFSFEIDTPVSFPYILSQKIIISYS